jgi:hypothetical protein
MSSSFTLLIGRILFVCYSLWELGIINLIFFNQVLLGSVALNGRK